MNRTTKRILASVIGWTVAVTGLHLWLNVDWAEYRNNALPESQRRLNVAYVPVT